MQVAMMDENLTVVSESGDMCTSELTLRVPLATPRYMVVNEMTYRAVDGNCWALIREDVPNFPPMKGFVSMKNYREWYHN